MGHGTGAQGTAVAYTPVTQLAAAHAVADVLARQHLREDAPATDVVQTARDLVGLHATGAPNPYLQLFTRMPGFTRQALDYSRISAAISWGVLSRSALRASHRCSGPRELSITRPLRSISASTDGGISAAM